LVENHFYMGRIKKYAKQMSDFAERLNLLEQKPKSD